MDTHCVCALTKSLECTALQRLQDVLNHRMQHIGFKGVWPAAENNISGSVEPNDKPTTPYVAYNTLHLLSLHIRDDTCKICLQLGWLEVCLCQQACYILVPLAAFPHCSNCRHGHILHAYEYVSVWFVRIRMY